MYPPLRGGYTLEPKPVGPRLGKFPAKTGVWGTRSAPNPCFFAVNLRTLPGRVYQRRGRLVGGVSFVRPLNRHSALPGQTLVILRHGVERVAALASQITNAVPGY